MTAPNYSRMFDNWRDHGLKLAAAIIEESYDVQLWLEALSLLAANIGGEDGARPRCLNCEHFDWQHGDEGCKRQIRETGRKPEMCPCAAKVSK